MVPKQTPTAKTMEEFQKEFMTEFRKKLVTAVVAGILAGVGAAILGIWSYVQRLPGSVGLVPSGAVVAFWSEPGANPDDVCKDGWSPVREAVGRTIFGAGKTDATWQRYVDGSSQPNGTLVAFTEKKPQEVGGEEAHVLTISEMPSHRHVSELATISGASTFGEAPPIKSTVNGAGRGGFPPIYTSAEGGVDVGHNSLPPFIALYYCKKD